jgi:hypothetical protein
MPLDNRRVVSFQSGEWILSRMGHKIGHIFHGWLNPEELTH